MMRTRRRRSLVILAGGVGLAGAVLAWPWLGPIVVEPLALVVWLLLRLFVLSLHQGVFWGALVLAAAAALVALLLRLARAASPQAPARAAPLQPVGRWWWLVAQAAGDARPAPAIGWSAFVNLVVSLRALELRVPADYRLHDALRDGRVPLPPGVHAFLFPPPDGRRAGPWAHPLRRLRARLSLAARRLSGRDRAERLDQLSELLSFLEESLELPSHDRHDRSHDPLHR